MNLKSCLTATILSLSVSCTLVWGQETKSTNSVENAMWKYVQDRADATSIERFLQLYPDSVYAEQATSLLEQSKQSPIIVGAEDANQGNTDAATNSELNAGSTANPISSGPITYESQLASASSADPSGSIKTLSQGSPLYPPVQGLPDEYWKDQTCSNCHEWGKENLCVQGQFFAKDGDAQLDRIDHPYGGYFKKALKDWALNECQ